MVTMSYFASYHFHILQNTRYKISYSTYSVRKCPYFLQGNLQNQSVVFGSKAVDYINFILRSKNYGKCSLEQASVEFLLN